MDRTQATPIKDTGLFISAKDWLKVRGDPAFVELVRLARVVNSLTLAWPPLLTSLEDQTPRARRERFAAIVYAGALLHEGLHTAQGLGQHFRDLPQYQEEFAPLFGDTEVRKFRTDVLDKIRDQLVFHFDREALATGLAHFPEGETQIAVTAEKEWSRGQVYFDVADDALLGFLFGDAPTEAEYLERVKYLLEATTSLFNRFMRGAHRLLPAALRKMGAYMKPVARPLPPTDDAAT